MKFPEITYANPTDPWLRRRIILGMERWAGRDYFVPLYDTWRRDIVTGPGPVIRPMLDLMRLRLDVTGAWPPALDTSAPLVIVANHPYGIADGIAALALAEELGRPCRVLINKDLMKIPEIRPYSLPVDFSQTRAARAANMAMRTEALKLLKEGVTIVVFPSGGVATAPSAFGRAVDLPWKTFTARMIQASTAQVLPVYFEGQCSPLFHVASRVNMTFRLSLMIRELRRMVGGTLKAQVGPIIPAADLAAFKDRLALMRLLYDRVHTMSGRPPSESRALAELLPDYLKGEE
ncbi:MAG: lysophospholipid acyltransferase family protein [Hyphomicrobiaceae bacterium]